VSRICLSSIASGCLPAIVSDSDHFTSHFFRQRKHRRAEHTTDADRRFSCLSM